MCDRMGKPFIDLKVKLGADCSAGQERSRVGDIIQGGTRQTHCQQAAAADAKEILR